VVARIEPRKNPIRVLEAYDRFRRDVPNPPLLVFAGMKTWSGRDFDQALTRLGLREYVRELGYVEHTHLPDLYAAARFTVFASLWEGFGLPALEALACGSPLIAGRTTSLPEICEGVSVLVDPTSADQICDAMRRLHTNPDLRDQLANSGPGRARSFTWERTAEETHAVYEELAKRRTLDSTV
jgi:alpha-1,3-rhamnosyl/mannosyltransferase